MATRSVQEAPGALQRLAAECSPDLTTVTGAGGILRFASSAGAASFGWRPDELVGRPLGALFHEEDVDSLEAAELALLTGRSQQEATVGRLRCADGSDRWVEVRAVAAATTEGRVVVSSVRDITDRHAIEEDLRRRAGSDPLTGVANRTVLLDRLEHALARLVRHDGFVAVLFVDLDRFKLVNDTLGHQAGDAVLVQAAARFRVALRPADTLARLGGDEFAVLAEDLGGPEAALALAERIVHAGRTPFGLGDGELTCTTSVGLAVTTSPHREPAALLREADLALYGAKERGRDRAELFDPSLHHRSRDRTAGAPTVIDLR